MDDPFAKLKFDPDTRAVLDEVKARLIETGLVDRRLDAATQEAHTLKTIIISSTMLPLYVRVLVRLRRPIRVWRARRALRPMRASIRARLPLPDPYKPWVEDHEAFRILLRGL